MEFRDRSSLAHKRNRVYQQPKSVSVSLFLDEVGKPLEPSVPWQHTYPCLDDHGHEPETECARWSSRTCVPLDLYKPNSPSFPLIIAVVPTFLVLALPSLDTSRSRRAAATRTTTTTRSTFNLNSGSSSRSARLRAAVTSPDPLQDPSARPGVAQRRGGGARGVWAVGVVSPDVRVVDWIGFVVEFGVEHESESEIGSGYEPESEPEPEPEPEPSSFAPVMDDMTDTRAGKLVYRRLIRGHTTVEDCTSIIRTTSAGSHVISRVATTTITTTGEKRNVSDRWFIWKGLVGRLVPWTSSSGKRVVVRAQEGPAMLNSDVPHPPWWLSYRSHTAFCLRQEARLDISPNAKVHIPRGGLITLLQKALLYIEVETHWSNSSGQPCLRVVDACLSGGTPQGRNGAKADKRRTSPKSANRQKRARLENQENKDKETTPGLGSRGPPQSSGTPNKKKTPNAKAKPAKPPAVITLKGHSLEVFVVAWNPKIPSLLATGGKDSTLRLWNVPEDGTEPILPTRICMHLPAGPACDITTISWNSDGTLLATGAYDGIVRVWTFRGELFCVMTQHQGPIFSVKWSKSGWLLTGSLDETAIVWDVDAGGRPKQRTSSDRSMADGCLDVEWLDGEFFATCGSDRNIFVECIVRVQALASGSDDYTACIWKVDDVAQYLAQSSKNIKPRPDVRSFTHKLRGHEGEVANIQWQPKGDRETYDPILVTSSFDGTVRMWNGHTGDCISIFQAGSGKVCGHSFAPRPDILAIVAGNKLILAKDGKEFFSWQDKDALFETAWRVDGKAVAAAMENSMVAVVRMPSITIPGEEDKAETA
ncbi:WD40 repeat-like protein [Rhizoctonia solani]|uniref:WD40 repeat-like protein n=1 Tax=Rhizoctonia solani TaxID=456999 RepID=A0A8H7ID97_9AGAM|nr:WD40 repeat-like protein [Rhizoctonia solani]